MSELNESTELANELIMDSVKEGEIEGKTSAWHNWVAFSTLLMALLTALGALLAGITANEALLSRTEEIIAISTCQGNRAAVEVLKAKHEILISLGETPDEAEIAQIKSYEAEMAELEDEVDRDEAWIQLFIYPHFIFAIAVTLLAVGTSLSGMAIIIDHKLLWYAGMVLGVVGSIGVVVGIVVMLSP